MEYGQVILGAPGSGKSTFCGGMKQFLTLKGRKCIVINLDPANENIPYSTEIDIRDLVSMEEVSEECKLGPNGSLKYAIDFLWENIDWLIESLHKFEDHYLLFDLPGQVELYILEDSFKKIFEKLAKELKIQLCCVHLTDSQYCTDPSKFISGVFVGLNSMLQLEFPFIHLLSKIDLIGQYGNSNLLKIKCYTDLDLGKIVEGVKEEEGFGGKFKQLNKKLCEIINDYALVSLTPSNINDGKSMSHILNLIDNANGYSQKQMAKQFIPNDLSSIEQDEEEIIQDLQYLIQSQNK